MGKKLLIFMGVGLVVLIGFFALRFFYFSPSSISRADATQLIKNLPEVKQYVNDLEKAGATSEFNVEDRGDEWVIQVFEIVNQGGTSHTATFNWYHINKKTAAIEKEF